MILFYGKSIDRLRINKKKKVRPAGRYFLIIVKVNDLPANSNNGEHILVHALFRCKHISLRGAGG